MYLTPRLFIVVERPENVEFIERILDTKALGWRNGRAFVAVANNLDVTITGRHLLVGREVVKLMDQVVVTKDAARQAAALARARELGYSIRLVDASSLTSWSREGMLEHVLRASMLTSSQQLATKVAPYMHAGGSQAMADAVQAWIQQWRKLGDEELGFALLDVLAFYDTLEICRLIAPDPQDMSELEAGNIALCTMAGMNSSAGPIARCFRNFAAQKIEFTLSQLSKREDLPERVVVLDDGLWSGFDAMKQIDAAMLCPSKSFTKARVELRFAMRTDLGEAALSSYLRANDYAQFSIRSTPVALNVLTDSGRLASSEGRLNHENVRDCRLEDEWTEPLAMALLKDRGVKPASLLKLEDLCRSLVAVNSDRGEAYVRGNRLGTNNIGGVTAFGHGVPMSLLPCYRARGKIQKPGGGGKFEWKPLFEIGKTDGKANVIPLAEA